MAHRVEMTIPARVLKRADAEFKVKRNGKMMGTLTVSNGSVVWYPSGTSYGRKATWLAFDQLMEGATRWEKR